MMGEPSINIYKDQDQTGLETLVSRWLEIFNRALQTQDTQCLRSIFRDDSHWRNVVGLDWNIATISGFDKIAPALLQSAAALGAGNFSLATDRVPPGVSRIAGEDVIDAMLRFETAVSTGVAHVRLQSSGADHVPRAWTLMTAIDTLKGHDLETERLAREGTAYERDWKGPNWADRRAESSSFADRDPTVLVVGGGHAGLTVAAWLKALNVDTLVVDRTARIGDNWRQRYHVLKLHSPTDAIDLPFIPFPSTWPKYIPKDKIANWLESYVESMEIDYWTKTSFEGASYDGIARRWNARLKLADGSVREIHPTQIIMATSQIGTPFVPRIPTLEQFAGPVTHSSQFKKGSDWSGKNVLVFGTGTSGHDISQELHAHGAHVTMVQRGKTEIIQVEPSAHMYLDALYQGDGPSVEDRDVIACSVPLPLMKKEHQLLTKIARINDRDLLDGLKSIGFKLEADEDSAGWPTKYFTRGGGYYFNVGASNLLIDGDIGLVQHEDIETFEADGIRLTDGRFLNIDLVILATGYKGFDDLVSQLFGEDMANRLGPVWGVNPDTQELSNMWTRTGQNGLWFAGGSFTHSRIYSKYIALQIKAEESGIFTKLSNIGEF